MSQHQEETTTTPTQLGKANQFTISGPIAINYATTSFTGEPRFSYKDAQLDLHFSGDEITRQDTPLGELVTVTLEDLSPVDGPRRTFTLLVPTVRLNMGGQVSFDTLGIETVQSGPRIVSPRALQTYSSHQLGGVAEVLDFFKTP